MMEDIVLEDKLDSGTRKMEKIKMQFLLQQPMTLQLISTLKIGDWIASRATSLSTELQESRFTQVMHKLTRAQPLDEESLTKEIEIIRNTVKHNFPKELQDQLTYAVQRALFNLARNNKPLWFNKKRQRYLIWRLTETIFTDNLGWLRINLEMLQSLCSQSYLLTGMERLELYYTHEKHTTNTIDHTENVINMVKHLHNLKYLTLQVICNDEILKCVVENCKLIEGFSLNLSSKIDDNSMHILVQLLNLRIVNLYGTSITEKGAETLLLTSKNITHLYMRCDYIMEAMKNIVSKPENVGKQLNLLSFVFLSQYIALGSLSLVVRLCPKIQQIQLKSGSDDNPPNFLLEINDFPNLFYLDLQYYQFYGDKVKNVLELKGPHLTHLHLWGVENVDLNILKCINQTCQNLECLQFRNCIFEQPTETNTYKRHTEWIAPDETPFNKLKRLVVHPRCLEEQPTEEQFLYLLRNSPKIEFFEIMESNLFTEDIILRLLEVNNLSELSELRVWRDTMSKVILGKLIENCIRPLTILIVDNFYYHKGYPCLQNKDNL